MNFVSYIIGKVLNRHQQTQSSHVSEHEIREAIAQLNEMSDRELSELGLARGGIEYAVRYGRSADQQAA